MRKKKEESTHKAPENIVENITQQRINETLEINFMPYAMSVIVSRAIPEIDGFKPSHRKLLYTMYKMGLLSGARTKSANVVGQTMKLNPHGDAAIYETLVRLTRGNQALLHPFVDSKGNFGKQYSRDMAYAASRYTEVKLEPICKELFGEIDKDTVLFVDNYDGTMKEPTLLPVTFPNVLVNPNLGIAVGMASNICSFNLREVCEGAIAHLKGKDNEIYDHIIAPDFSTGGAIVYDREQMTEIMKQGRGSFKVRAKYRVDKQNSCIEIYEIPYTTNSESIIDKIVDGVKGGKLKEINDVRDETDLKGLKITIDIKKNCNPETLMTKLFKMTPLEDSYGCNFNILIDGHPRVMGVAEILKEWSVFRMQCIKNGLAHDIAEKKARLHLLLGLKKILLDIDKAIVIIRETKLDSEVVPNLIKGFDIDEKQAEFVAEIKLRNINEEYILKRVHDVDVLQEDIQKMTAILESDTEVRKLIISQLKEIAKKYGEDRKTTLIDKENVAEPEEENFIEDYNCKIFMTRDNYFKKISLASLRAYAEQKLKPDDVMIVEQEASNKEDILFFSDKGQVYKAHLYELADSKASVLGEYLPNLLSMEEDEKIVYATTTADYSGMMIFAFENGKIAKVDMKGYETKTNRKKLTAAYHTKSPLAGIFYLAEDGMITMTSQGGRALTCSSELINLKSKRDTQGVQVYLSKRDKFLQNCTPAEQSGLEDPMAYRVTKIPNAGQRLKGDDETVKQLNLFEG